jgi:tRNA-2-methylthio-N6-dimethylallyladenosine synthase
MGKAFDIGLEKIQSAEPPLETQGGASAQLSGAERGGLAQARVPVPVGPAEVEGGALAGKEEGFLAAKTPLGMTGLGSGEEGALADSLGRSKARPLHEQGHLRVLGQAEDRTIQDQQPASEGGPYRNLSDGGAQTFYLETFGCQMNEHDSEKVAGVLLARGYRQVESADAANVVLYNTCSIREKAAQKVFSRLGEWRPGEGSSQYQGRETQDPQTGGGAPTQLAGAEKGGLTQARVPVPRKPAETEGGASAQREEGFLVAKTPLGMTGVGADSLGRSKVRPLHKRGHLPVLGQSEVQTMQNERPASLRENSSGQTEGGRYRNVAHGRGKIIGVLGCVAQQEGEKIFSRAPWVSLVCGSASYRKLPELLAQLEAGNRRVTGLDTDTDETFETEVTRRDNPWRAYLTIIEGCDKACSYCVVPFTRGPERSRTSASILEEVRQLADVGYTEVQLLGQTVNSYADPSARKMRFSELLVAVAEVPGMRRVRFTTSHPRDFGKDIVEAIETVPAICEHVHLPVQCGSTKVLRGMARTYTREEYLEKIAMLRAAKREISLTTDLIVGFPGETEKDFEETLSLLDVAQYDGAFCFKYSPRPNTPSLKMEDAIPEEEKSRRLAILLEKQREIQRARNEKLVGRELEVMVEGKSKKEFQWSGHTSANKVMNFTSRAQESLGDYVQVKVVGVTPNSLVGERTAVASE